MVVYGSGFSPLGGLRAAIAAELATMERGNPTGANQHTAGKGQNCTFPKDAMSIDQLAEALSVSPRSVKAAKARMKEDPRSHGKPVERAASAGRGIAPAGQASDL